MQLMIPSSKRGEKSYLGISAWCGSDNCLGSAELRRGSLSGSFLQAEKAKCCICSAELVWRVVKLSGYTAMRKSSEKLWVSVPCTPFGPASGGGSAPKGRGAAEHFRLHQALSETDSTSCYAPTAVGRC